MLFSQRSGKVFAFCYDRPVNALQVSTVILPHRRSRRDQTVLPNVRSTISEAAEVKQDRAARGCA